MEKSFIGVFGINEFFIRTGIIPFGYRVWTKEVSKLELAADMVRTVMPELVHKHQVLFLFDSWYAKKVLVCLGNKYENLDIICNARYDSVIYDLSQAPTGKRERPAKRGKRLSSMEDFLFQTKRLEIIMWVFVEYS